MPNTDRLTRHNQECMQQHNVEYGVSNSSLEFERLRTQERIAERLTKEDSFECTSEDSNTQVQAHCHEQPEGAKGCRSYKATVHGKAEQV